MNALRPAAIVLVAFISLAQAGCGSPPVGTPEAAREFLIGQLEAFMDSANGSPVIAIDISNTYGINARPIDYGIIGIKPADSWVQTENWELSGDFTHWPAYYARVLLYYDATAKYSTARGRYYLRWDPKEKSWGLGSAR